jgi:DNA-binding transcriptional MocR family regulator
MVTIWIPALADDGPRYRAIANAIASAITDGELEPGDRLPPQRQLADALSVTVGTVSRGYAEAERRGLIAGEVGRGTFVRGPSGHDPWPETSDESGAIDLSLSLPTRLPEEATMLGDTLREIANGPRVDELLAYNPRTGTPQQLTAGAQWLGRVGLRAGADQVLLTAGSQHGLNAVFGALFGRDAVVLAGELTYPSIKVIARSFGVRLRPIELDQQGMIPEAIERACRQEPGPVGIYVVPTVQNPTSATLSAKRRQAVAEIAREHELWIVEDDIHAMLPPKPHQPIAALAPERTIYLSSVSKCLAPGLRTGFVLAPPPLRARMLSAIHATLWMPPPLMVELTRRWIVDGVADQLLARKRADTHRRQKLVKRILGHHDPLIDPYGYQVWLPIPEPLHTDEFVASARERGVIVVGAGAFAIGGRQPPAAVRLSIGLPDLPRLEKALHIIDELLITGAAPSY